MDSLSSPRALQILRLQLVQAEPRRGGYLVGMANRFLSPTKSASALFNSKPISQEIQLAVLGHGICTKDFAWSRACV